MSSGKLDFQSHEKLEDELKAKAKEHFEPQLEALGLGAEQIERQSLDELRGSLENVNDAIKNPDQFASINLSVSAKVGLVLVSDVSSTRHFKVGILPLLLERKKRIIERIQEFEGPNELEELLSEINDDKMRDKLKASIELREEKYSASSESMKRSHEIELEMADLQMSMLERRMNIWHKFIQRESMASIIGACLLALFSVVEIISVLFQLPTSELMRNAFLVILGYFFGQAALKKSGDDP